MARLVERVQMDGQKDGRAGVVVGAEKPLILTCQRLSVSPDL